LTYGTNGNEYDEWKWFIGPLPFPRFLLVLMPAATKRVAARTALGMAMPQATLDAIAAESSN